MKCTAATAKKAAGALKCRTTPPPTWAASKKSSSTSAAPAPTAASSTKPAATASSVFPKPKPRAASTPPPPPVAVLPELPDVAINIDPKDIEESGCRGGGPGGQNVNKVETGWFIRYKPTGLTFKITELRSQGQNKERAWSLLRAKLFELEQQKQHAAVSASRKSMMGSGDRSQRIRTYNFPQNRCTDHRLGGQNADAESGGKNFSLEKIMAGDLNDLLNALIELDKQQRASPHCDQFPNQKRFDGADCC